MNLAPPFVLLEVPAPEGAQRAWRPEYTFDTTDNGRMEPLPEFLFELRHEPDTKDRNGRVLRLYQDGQPCIGAQWQYSIGSTLHSIEHVVGSYAHHRRALIYAYQRKELAHE